MKRIGKKALGFALSFAMIWGIVTPNTNVASAAKAVKLSSKSVSLKVGQTKTVKVKNTKKKVKWSIKKGSKYISMTKKKKLSVTVKGKRAGKSTVQAKIGKKKLICKVTVKNVVAATATPVIQTARPISTLPTTSPSAAPSTAPSIAPSTQPSAVPTAEPTQVPKATPNPTFAPDETPGPNEFAYDGTDASWIDNTKPMVAFSFDDGPIGNADTDNSMIIQNALHNHGAHATFFYIGKLINSDATRAEILQAKEWGFDVGNHSWSYTSLLTQDEEGLDDSVGATSDVLKEITGYNNFPFRAPNLQVSETMESYLKMPIINAATDSRDWAEATTEEIIANVKAAKDGDIVLMHETQKNTAAAINTILDYFQEKGWQVVSVSELFAARGERMKFGQQYSNCPPVE